MTTPLTSLQQQRASARSVLPWLTGSPLHLLPLTDETVRYVLALPAHQVWTPRSWYTGQPLPENWWNLWEPFLQQEPELLYVMACAPSGQVRMRACLELAKQPSQLGLALLLVRSNDWVDIVRQTARSSLSSFLRPACAAWWVEVLPLVLRFEQNLRAPFPALQETVKALLQMPETAIAVAEGWRSPSEHVRRSLLKLLGTAELPADVQTLLASDADQKIRRALVPVASLEILRLLLNDSVANIRSAAFARLLPSLDSDPQVPEFRITLLDPRSTVRWQAQYALRQAGIDVRAYYLQHDFHELTPSEKVGLLGGLFDVGLPEDAPQVSQHLNPNEPPAVRAEALRTLTRLDASGVQPLLWQALQKPGQAARQAERSLVRNDLVTEQELQTLWDTGSRRNRQTALRLARTLPRFQAAALLLEWRPAEPELVQQIDTALVKQLGGYGNAFVVRPQPALLQRLLAGQTPELPEKVLDTLKALAS